MGFVEGWLWFAKHTTARFQRRSTRGTVEGFAIHSHPPGITMLFWRQSERNEFRSTGVR